MVFSDVTLHSVVEMYQFGETYRFHLQGRVQLLSALKIKTHTQQVPPNYS
jgi:hypothetical protein